MFIVRKFISHNRTPFGLPFSELGKPVGRGRGNGGASRKLVIIGLSFFSIPKQKWYGADDALKMLWWARKWDMCWCWRE